MLVCTSWKLRANTPDATNRMMATWGKMEADTAANPHMERLCWYIFNDGTGGFTVSRVADEVEAHQFALETSLALGEFLEVESHLVQDLDTAMPAITAAVERINA